jgi:phosphatidylinositol glycan class M
MASSSFPALGKLLLLPQLVLLLYSSLGIAPFDLSFALFVQTFFFVALNKVITAQYFTWYLVLLPLCSDRIRWGSKDVISALSLLGLSIIIWLGAAFCLEMKGMAVHLQVWIASLLFFAANVNVLRTILANYKGSGKQKME